MTDQTPVLQPAPPAPLSAPVAPWNVLAIVSLITSLIGFGIAGIITGHLALGQIKQTGEQGRGLALAGTIVGYASVGFVVLFGLIALIFAVVVPLIFLGTVGSMDYRY